MKAKAVPYGFPNGKRNFLSMLLISAAVFMAPGLRNGFTPDNSASFPSASPSAQKLIDIMHSVGHALVKPKPAVSVATPAYASAIAPVIMHNNVAPPTAAVAAPVIKPYFAAVTPTANPLADAVNQYISQAAAHLQKRGVHYDLHDQNGGINCSTFAQKMVIGAMRLVNKNDGPTYDVSGIQAKLMGTSENQILYTQSNTSTDYDRRLPSFSQDTLLAAADKGQLQTGMLVGLAFNTIHESFAAGRTNNISHVGVITEQNGKLMIADCNADHGVGGVRIIPLKDWVNKYAHVSGGSRFYIGSPFAVAALPQKQDAVRTAFMMPPRAAEPVQNQMEMAAATRHAHKSYRFAYAHRHHRYWTHHYNYDMAARHVTAPRVAYAPAATPNQREMATPLQMAQPGSPIYSMRVNNLAYTFG